MPSFSANERMHAMNSMRRVRRLIVIVTFDGVNMLDFSGTSQVFSTSREVVMAAGNNGVTRDPYEIVLTSSKGGLIQTSSGIRVETVSLRSLRPRMNEIDTLVVSGGPRVSIARQDRVLMEWVAEAAENARRICSVCSGAFILAEAGLLSGRRAVTHWKHCAQLTNEYPDIRVEPDSIFIRDGRIWTSAGVTAGIDLSLALVEADLGRRVAMAVARHLIVFLKRPGGQSQFSEPLKAQTVAANIDTSERFSALHAWMADNLASDLSVERLAERAGMSARTFARAFLGVTGNTPGKAVETMRVEAARRALESGDESIKQIAASSGFGDDERMRRAFQRHLKVNPVNYRSRFSKGQAGYA
jgi:transcriptional regulator GlxA family with amidase domain